MGAVWHYSHTLILYYTVLCKLPMLGFTFTFTFIYIHSNYSLGTSCSLVRSQSSSQHRHGRLRLNSSVDVTKMFDTEVSLLPKYWD